MAKYDLSDFESVIKKNVNGDRYRHILGVAYTSANLAMKYAMDAGMTEQSMEAFIQDAHVAGLLHDNAKHIPPEDLVKLCKKNGLPISECELAAPYLLHGRLGAFYARTRFGIENEDILNAIEFHTTGRPGMSLMEKIVFTADYIEPNRNKQPNLQNVRHLAYVDLDRCVYQICEDTLTYLDSRKKPVDTMTIATRDYYKNIM